MGFFYVFLLKALKGSTFQGSHQDKKHCQRDIMMVGPYYMSFIPLLVFFFSFIFIITYTSLCAAPAQQTSLGESEEENSPSSPDSGTSSGNRNQGSHLMFSHTAPVRKPGNTSDWFYLQQNACEILSWSLKKIWRIWT